MTKPVNNTDTKNTKTVPEFSEVDVFRIINLVSGNQHYSPKFAIGMVRFNKKLTAKNTAYKQSEN